MIGWGIPPICMGIPPMGMPGGIPPICILGGIPPIGMPGGIPPMGIPGGIPFMGMPGGIPPIGIPIPGLGGPPKPNGWPGPCPLMAADVLCHL